MRAAGLAGDAVEYGDFSAHGGATAMARLLDAHPDLDAVFVASDTMASGALTHLAASGITVPDDVAVFGFDNIGLARTTDPQLSTVAHPVAEMAARAGRMLEDLLAGVELGPDPVLFEAKLVLRESA
jgi:DNA-binding LacI/PurR family transcriptional regulator